MVGKACHPEQVASPTAYAVRKQTLQNASVHLTFFFVFSSVIENIHDGYSLLFQRKLNFLSAIQTKKDGTTATSWRRFRVHLVTRTILELF